MRAGKEGITTAFPAFPGCNQPLLFSWVMRKHGRHSPYILARVMWKALHISAFEGYTTRAAAGNIGVSPGTSGPAGTDMIITALHSASADSIPILCITGRATSASAQGRFPQSILKRLQKPVSKMVRRFVRRRWCRAYKQVTLMRSGRPRSPVLVDLPFDVQSCGDEFDPEAHEPPPVYKPAASRVQIEKGAELIQSERPVLSRAALNADAAPLLQQFAELTSVPVILYLMGWASPGRSPHRRGWSARKPRIATGNATCWHPIWFWHGNRFANRHTGSAAEKYTQGRKSSISILNRRKLPRVVPADLGIVSDAKSG